MKNRKLVSLIFVLVAVALGLLLFMDLTFPAGIRPYLKRGYYTQFGPLAIAIELFTAGMYLLRKHSKTNFAMALFGFTALLDLIFNLVGLFSSNTPIYATILFSICAIIALRIAFTNQFNTKRISMTNAFGSFALGTGIELFFYYF